MKLKEIVKKIALFSISVWVYVPIIAGLITQMLYMIPLAYTSWVLFLSLGYASWADLIYIFGLGGKYLPLGIFLFVFECIIFVVGLTLFFWGFIHIVRVRKNDINIAQTGPYKYIRHPQHLGIILSSLPFAIWIIPRFDSGILISIRVGDILSWVLFCFVLIIWSDVEERKLQKTYPEEFATYKTRTGFFFPKIRNQKTLKIQKKKCYYIIRYLSFFLIYCIVALIMYLITRYIPGSVSR